MEWTRDDVEATLLDPSLASKTLAINEKVGRLRGEGVLVYHFGFGESPFEVEESVVEELKRNAHMNSYLPVKGLLKLRERAAGFMKSYFGAEFHPDHISFAPGSKPLLSNVVHSINAEYLLPTPCWVSYRPQCKIFGRSFVRLECSADNGWKLTPDILETECAKDPTKRRVLVFTYPNNPTGVTYSKDELLALIVVLRKYKVLVLSDEIYGVLSAVDKPHWSMAHPEMYPEGAIVTNGMSKFLGAGGWRVGFICFPPNLSFVCPAINMLGSTSYSHCPAPQQYACMLALDPENEAIPKYLMAQRIILDQLRKVIYELVATSKIITANPAEVDMASFYMYYDFGNYRELLRAKHGINTAAELCDYLLENLHTAFLHGGAFERDPAELGCRVALTDFKETAGVLLRKVIADPTDISDEDIVQYCPRVVEGTKIVLKFLEDLEAE